MRSLFLIVLFAISSFGYTRYVRTDTLRVDSIAQMKKARVTSLTAGTVKSDASGNLSIGIPDSASVSHYATHADSAGKIPDSVSIAAIKAKRAWLDSAHVPVINDSTIFRYDITAPNMNYSTGLITEPAISWVDDTHISIDTCQVLIKNPTTSSNRYLRCVVPQNTNLLVAADAINCVYVSWNSGNPIYVSTVNFETAILPDNVPVVRLLMDSVANLIEYKLYYGNTAINMPTKALFKELQVGGVGGIIKENGGLAISETATRVINIGSGVVWFGMRRIGTDTLVAIAQGGAGVVSELVYHKAGVWTDSTITTYSNQRYDNGTDLVALLPNRYAVNWIYRNVDMKEIDVVLGGGDYTLAQATASPVPEVPLFLNDFYVLCGRIIVKNGDNTATSIENVSTTHFSTSSTSNHNDLSNLSYSTAAHTGFATGTSGKADSATKADTSLHDRNHGVTVGTVPLAAAGATWGNSLLSQDATGVILGTTNPAPNGLNPYIMNPAAVLNMAQVSFYPSSGTNVNCAFMVVPKGAGSGGLNSQFALMGTDYVADATNYDFLTCRHTGTLTFMATGKGGSGTSKPIMIATRYAEDVTTNANQLYLTTDNRVGVGLIPTVSNFEVNVTANQSGIKLGGIEFQSLGTNSGWFVNNAYWNGSAWKYRADGYAAIAGHYNGTFTIYTAPSGLATNTATMTERFTVANTGLVTVAGALTQSSGASTLDSLNVHGTVIQKDGAVGIGTGSAVDAKVSIFANANTTGATPPLTESIDIYNISATANVWSAIQFGSLNKNSTLGIGAAIGAQYTNNRTIGIGNQIVTDLVFFTGDINPNPMAERMRLTSVGYLGIGTAAPIERLTNKGNFVDTGWAKIDSIYTYTILGRDSLSLKNNVSVSGNLNITGNLGLNGSVVGVLNVGQLKAGDAEHFYLQAQNTIYLQSRFNPADTWHTMQMTNLTGTTLYTAVDVKGTFSIGATYHPLDSLYSQDDVADSLVIASGGKVWKLPLPAK